MSARQFGKTFTTSVFTDAAGECPTFRAWKRGNTTSGRRPSATTPASSRASLWDPRCTGGTFFAQGARELRDAVAGRRVGAASLPEDTPHDRKMKEVFRLNCFGGCHSPSHALKDRYDEDGLE